MPCVTPARALKSTQVPAFCSHDLTRGFGILPITTSLSELGDGDVCCTAAGIFAESFPQNRPRIDMVPLALAE